MPMPQTPNTTEAGAAWAEIEPAFNVLNGALVKAGWLAGVGFSIVDVNVAGALFRGLSMDLSRWLALSAWLSRCWAGGETGAVAAGGVGLPPSGDQA